MLPRPPVRSEANARHASLDYLRAFIVLLVLLHHSVLAYAVMWPAQPRIFSIAPAPIVDPQRWTGFDLLVIFNDTFFMALMFLLSGLFVWPGLESKGPARFLRDRILRLGVPFAVVVGILMPIAYYPTYRLTGADAGIVAYARTWHSLGFWPSGPAWFIWLLLAFDAVAAGLHALRRRWTGPELGARFAGVHGNPLAFLGVLLGVSALAYVPLELIFGADDWVTLGVFSFQTSRPLLYAAWFLVGLRLGATGAGGGFPARNAALVRRWPIWLSAGLAAYVLRLAIIIALILPVVIAHRPMPLALRLLSDLSLVLCCATLGLACIAIFGRFATARRPVFDSLGASSYGMYLVHYPVVAWLQWALLAVALGPMAKGAVVFVATVGLSWGIVVALRRVPVIARII